MLVAQASRKSGRARKKKERFEPGPSKKQLLFAEKRQQGALKQWEKQRVVNKNSARFLVTTPPAIITSPNIIRLPTKGTVEERLAKGIESVVKGTLPQQMPRKKKARMILMGLRNGSIYGKDGQYEIKEMVRQMGRDIYSPYRIAWAMAESASLSGKNVEQLRAVEKPGFNDEVMLPSKSAANRENYDLENWAESYFNLKVMVIPSTVSGKTAEGYGFDTKRLVRFIIKKFGLEEIAKTQAIEMKITYDGAQLTKNNRHIALGFQPVDPRCTNPRMPDKFLYLNDEGEMQSFQSRDNTVIAHSHDG
jgi:hypothetical protein